MVRDVVGGVGVGVIGVELLVFGFVEFLGLLMFLLFDGLFGFGCLCVVLVVDFGDVVGYVIGYC